MNNIIIEDLYKIKIISANKSQVGVGSDTYFIECDNGKYVVKFPFESEMNNLNLEPFLCYFIYGKLNSYDIEIMPKLFYYQIAVCDYYNQYYRSDADNRNIYLYQAVFSTKLMRWFEKNIENLSEILTKQFAL